MRSNDWRTKEISLKDAINEFPDMPSLELVKVDVTRRGIKYTDAALKLVDPEVHQTELRYMFAERNEVKPISFTFRDGNSITNVMEAGDNAYRDPYIIDAIGGKPYIVDNDEVIEEIHYWRKPDYFRKKTSKGTPMWHIVNARPQRLDVMPNDQCHFWDKPGGGCKYCWAGGGYNKFETCNRNCRFGLDELSETIREALKQPGRFSAIMFSGGSILSGEELFDDEVNNYIDVINAVGENFKTKRFPGQLIATAFSKKQLEKIYNNTGIMNYTADIEVLNPKKFAWICPGKEEFVGYYNWKQRLFDAVDIFGPGNVNSGFVGGVELAKPHGFADEDEALKNVLEEAEDLYAHGVGLAGGVWVASDVSIFKNKITPSLSYYSRLFLGLDKIARKYNFNPYMDDYRRCGSHINTDLGRM